jgi:hypothetical protein
MTVTSLKNQSDNVHSSSSGGGTDKFLKNGSWFRDKEGRYILFRGVKVLTSPAKDMISKTAFSSTFS